MSTCDIAGHASLYGLGIRIGTYLQWGAALLSLGRWGGRESPSLVSLPCFLQIATRVLTGLKPAALKASVLFQLAFLISMIWTASTSLSDYYDIEFYILTTFGLAGGFVTYAAGLAAGVSLFLQISSIILCLASFGFAFWFWFTGLRHMVSTVWPPHPSTR